MPLRARIWAVSMVVMFSTDTGSLIRDWTSSAISRPLRGFRGVAATIRASTSGSTAPASGSIS